MSGISRITKGMIEKVTTIETAKIYYPLTVTVNNKKPKINIDLDEKIDLTTKVIKLSTIDVNKQKPSITIRPIEKQIHLDVKCDEE